MSERIQRQYGLWDSPISPRMLAASQRLQDAAWDTNGETLVWLEGRSAQGVLIAQGPPNDAPRDLTSDLSVRAEVGYGGGDFTVHGGVVYFIAHKTGRIFRQRIAGGAARPVTPPFGKAASPTVSPFGSWIAYVHHHEGVDRLAVVDAEGKFWPQSIVSGDDFYMQPVWSPDGKKLAWVSWNHPRMPWDGTTVSVAAVHEVENGLPVPGEVQTIAGGEDEAIFQPQFSTDGRSLFYVSDADGWPHLYRHDLEDGERTQLTQGDGDYGLPAWVQNMRSYALSADGSFAVCARGEQGFVRIQRVDVETGDTANIGALEGYTDAQQFSCSPRGSQVSFLASSARVAPRLVVHDFESGETRVAARASGETLSTEELAAPEAIVWETSDGEEAHGLFYPPTSPRFESSGAPPLLVLIHGGPTGQVRAQWNPQAQFFATRGFAVLNVNYRGSTGYGRAYMQRLRGDWGICDVQDAVSAKNYLAEEGRIDKKRTAIMGGSAGGFTVLQTMVVKPKAFTAGISLYGVSNQFTLATDTHKFEERYLDSLLGPLPESASVYRERSPVYHAEKIRRPLAVFQGDVDQVVPRDQSDAIVAALKRKGVPHVYHVYEGEGHGWRQRETIEHFYGAVEKFLREFVVFS